MNHTQTFKPLSHLYEHSSNPLLGDEYPWAVLHQDNWKYQILTLAKSSSIILAFPSVLHLAGAGSIQGPSPSLHGVQGFSQRDIKKTIEFTFFNQVFLVFFAAVLLLLSFSTVNVLLNLVTACLSRSSAPHCTKSGTLSHPAIPSSY